MALPKLNDNPKYDLVIPSTNKQVKFRPYLVKEEKVLMLASESGDQKATLGAIVDTLKACITEDINANELTTFDVEYMFTQIRSKSVGESSRINVTCNSCNHQTEVDVPLDEIKMDMPIVDPNIALTDQISLKMKWPSYVEVMEQDLVDKNETQQTFELLIECIEKVVTQDENIIFKDEPRQSRLEFVESLTASQFSKIRSYIEKMPKMKYDLKYNCGNCGQEHKLTLEGMQDFL